MTLNLEDPIVADVYRFREQYAKTFDYDVSAMMEELIREQETLEHQGCGFASYPPQRCQPVFPYAPVEDLPNAGSVVNLSVAHPNSPTTIE